MLEFKLGCYRPQLVGYPDMKVPYAYVAIGMELVYTGGN